MKCCDDGLVSREAVICMKRPQKELVGHLLDSCMQAHRFLTQPLTCYSAQAYKMSPR